ncbi:MAG: low molecular weight protein arginine phosphatase [Desulfobacteraceae bacterium]|nr:low molecular weight protein arginine phosphatase [Desulfobacteraceae bacterium]
MYKILCICTGNTCRSPMAEAMLKSMLPKKLKKIVEVSSAGTYASERQYAALEAVDAMKEHGINIEDHRSRLLVPEMYTPANLILVTDQLNEEIMKRAVPEKDIRLLTSFRFNKEPHEIPDPYNKPTDAYRNCAAMIRECVEGVVEFLEQNLN